jgi:hypothetical protein
VVIGMRFIIYAIVFATSFTVVALVIVLAIPIGTAIDCPICTNKTAIALIALGSASAGAVLDSERPGYIEHGRIETTRMFEKMTVSDRIKRQRRRPSGLSIIYSICSPCTKTTPSSFIPTRCRRRF